MGVMSCNRNNCPHIMCDTYIDSVGYICRECQSEFENWLKKNEASPKTDNEINKHLKVFMKIEHSGSNNGNEISVSDFFKAHTKWY